MHRFTVAFAEGETSAMRFGADGPPDLVLLHATGFNAGTYRPILEALGTQFRVVAIDQRGHGRCKLAARPERLRSWADYVEDFLTLGKNLWGDAPPPVLAGHSMGGAVALMATARRPALADRLVLLDPVMPSNRLALLAMWLLPLRARIDRIPIAQGAARRRARFATRADAIASYRGRGAFATWDAAFLEAYVQDGFKDTDDGDVTLSCAPLWEAATFAGLRVNVAGALGRLKRPALILRAGRGSALRVSDERLLALNPNLGLETVSGTTHFLPMEVPNLVCERLTRALKERAGGLALSPTDEADVPGTAPFLRADFGGSPSSSP